MPDFVWRWTSAGFRYAVAATALRRSGSEKILNVARMLPGRLRGRAPFAVGFLAYTNVTDAVDLFATVLFYFALFLMLVHSPMVFRTHVPFSIA